MTPASASRRDITAAGLLALVWAWLAWVTLTPGLPGTGQAFLQAALLLGVIVALHRPAAAGSGVIAGLLVAASLAIGLQPLPLSVGIGIFAAIQWKEARPGAAERLHGIGIGVLVGLATARGLSTTWATAPLL